MSFPRFFLYKFAINVIPYHFLLIFFPLDFKGALMEYQHIYVISIFLLFSQKVLRSFSDDISIHPNTQIGFSSDFFHRVFRGAFPYNQTMNEDYKTT